MSLSYYLDDDSGIRSLVQQASTLGLRILRSDEAGLRGARDEEHLSFAAANAMVLVTSNDGDFQTLHWAWMGASRSHAGIIIAAQLIPTGERIRRLLDLMQTADPRDLANNLRFLSDWR